MQNSQPFVTAAGPRHRKFTTSAVAVQAIVIKEKEQVLLLAKPGEKQIWQIVSGALEAGETLLDGTLREVSEELGSDIKVRPLGVAHVETFHFDENVPFMLGTYYLFAYLGGNIVPGDDMAGSDFRWWSLAELEKETPKLHASSKLWMLKRAVELYQLWVEQPNVPLQPGLALVILKENT